MKGLNTLKELGAKEISEYYNYGRMRIKASMLRRGVKLYTLARSKFIGDMLKAERTGAEVDGSGHWIDVAGEYMPTSAMERLLADIESTINIYTVNCRLTSYPVANDGSVKESLVQFFKNLAAGKRGIITDNSIIENFRNVDINRGTIKDGLNDLLIARDKILEEFYRDIGVKMHINKKAQMNEEEVSSDNQLLLISTDSMLKARREGIEMVNNMFGTDISVDINPLYKVEIERSEDNAQVNRLSE